MSEQNQDMMATLQKMQQQLTYLEKKLDTLLAQSQQKAFSRPGNFPRPFRPAFGRPNNNNSSHGPSHGHFAPKKKPHFGQGRAH